MTAATTDWYMEVCGGGGDEACAVHLWCPAVDAAGWRSYRPPTWLYAWKHGNADLLGCTRCVVAYRDLLVEKLQSLPIEAVEAFTTTLVQLDKRRINNALLFALEGNNSCLEDILPSDEHAMHVRALPMGKICAALLQDALMVEAIFSETGIAVQLSRLLSSTLSEPMLEDGIQLRTRPSGVFGLLVDPNSNVRSWTRLQIHEGGPICVDELTDNIYRLHLRAWIDSLHENDAAFPPSSVQVDHVWFAMDVVTSSLTLLLCVNVQISTCLNFHSALPFHISAKVLGLLDENALEKLCDHRGDLVRTVWEHVDKLRHHIPSWELSSTSPLHDASIEKHADKAVHVLRIAVTLVTRLWIPEDVVSVFFVVVDAFQASLLLLRRRDVAQESLHLLLAFCHVQVQGLPHYLQVKTLHTTYTILGRMYTANTILHCSPCCILRPLSGSNLMFSKQDLHANHDVSFPLHDAPGDQVTMDGSSFVYPWAHVDQSTTFPDLHYGMLKAALDSCASWPTKLLHVLGPSLFIQGQGLTSSNASIVAESIQLVTTFLVQNTHLVKVVFMSTMRLLVQGGNDAPSSGTALSLSPVEMFADLVDEKMLSLNNYITTGVMESLPIEAVPLDVHSCLVESVSSLSVADPATLLELWKARRQQQQQSSLDSQNQTQDHRDQVSLEMVLRHISQDLNLYRARFRKHLRRICDFIVAGSLSPVDVPMSLAPAFDKWMLFSADVMCVLMDISIGVDDAVSAMASTLMRTFAVAIEDHDEKREDSDVSDQCSGASAQALSAFKARAYALPHHKALLAFVQHAPQV
jgi:hypothetical protein